MEPIRQVPTDQNKEQRVANFLVQKMPWSLFPTPKFYFTDYHINRKHDNGRENYIGDLEIKWLNSPSTSPAIFPYNKLHTRKDTNETDMVVWVRVDEFLGYFRPYVVN